MTTSSPIIVHDYKVYADLSTITVPNQVFTGTVTATQGLITNPTQAGVNNVLTNYYNLTPVNTTWTSNSWSTPTLQALWDYEVIGERVFLDLAGFQQAGSGSGADLIVTGAIIPAQLRPTVDRICGPLPVISNGVILNTGYIIVKTTGIIQIGISLATASTLTNFPNSAGVNGLIATQIQYVA